MVILQTIDLYVLNIKLSILVCRQVAVKRMEQDGWENVFSEYFYAKILSESNNIDIVKKEPDICFKGMINEQ